MFDSAVESNPAALDVIVGAVIELELWDEVLAIAEGASALLSTLAERISSLPARRRRTLAKRATEEGTIERLGPLGTALAL